jgi:large subunit ribosomal protein L7Ae
VKEGYLEKNEEAKRHWGGGIMGAKAQARDKKAAQRAEREIKI